MATFRINVVTIDDFEFQDLIVNTPDGTTLQRGDSFEFNWESTNDFGVTVTNLPSLAFGGANANTGLNQFNPQFTRTIVNTAAFQNYTFVVEGNGFSRVVNFNVQSSVVTKPDPMLFESVGNVNPSTFVYSNSVQVTGINTSVAVSVTNGSFKINTGGAASSGTYLTSGTVSPNQFIVLRVMSSSSFNTNKLMTITVGEASGNRISTWAVRTSADADQGTKIPFPVLANGGDVRLKQLGDFFGRPLWSQTVLGDYLKSPGGAFVPNIMENDNIPTSGDLILGLFQGSATSLYWTKTPSDKIELADNSLIGGELDIDWRSIKDSPTVGSDFDVGFNTLMRDNVEYKYELFVEAPYENRVVQEIGNSSWSNAQLTAIKFAYSHNEQEKSVKGTMTISARHKLYTEYSISTVCNFEFLIYQ